VILLISVSQISRIIGVNPRCPDYETFFKEELLPILLKFFPKIEEEGKFPNLLYEDSIILLAEPKKDTIRKI
jgi:hypothetical protein